MPGGGRSRYNPIDGAELAGFMANCLLEGKCANEEVRCEAGGRSSGYPAVHCGSLEPGWGLQAGPHVSVQAWPCTARQHLGCQSAQRALAAAANQHGQPAGAGWLVAASCVHVLTNTAALPAFRRQPELAGRRC